MVLNNDWHNLSKEPSRLGKQLGGVTERLMKILSNQFSISQSTSMQVNWSDSPALKLR